MEIEVYKLFWGYLEHLMVKAILTWDSYYWAFNAVIWQTNRLLEDLKISHGGLTHKLVWSIRFNQNVFVLEILWLKTLIDNLGGVNLIKGLFIKTREPQELSLSQHFCRSY